MAMSLILSWLSSLCSTLKGSSPCAAIGVSRSPPEQAGAVSLPVEPSLYCAAVVSAPLSCAATSAPLSCTAAMTPLPCVAAPLPLHLSPAPPPAEREEEATFAGCQLAADGHCRSLLVVAAGQIAALLTSPVAPAASIGGG
jgi:hypothetical protein